MNGACPCHANLVPKKFISEDNNPLTKYQNEKFVKLSRISHVTHELLTSLNLCYFTFSKAYE